MTEDHDERTPVHRLFDDGGPLLGALHAASVAERRAASAALAYKTEHGAYSRRLLDAWMTALEGVEAATTALIRAGVV